MQGRILEAESVSAVGVVRIADSVGSDFPASCGVPAWRRYPQLRAVADRAVQSPAGMFLDGSFSINRNPELPASNGAICWCPSSQEDLWSLSYPSEGSYFIFASFKMLHFF